MLENLEIREAIKKKRLFYYEVAKILGTSPEQFSKMLRYELPDAKKQQILQAIHGYEV